jgi:ParB family transcriptional regulator, chromosome partitioning protein
LTDLTAQRTAAMRAILSQRHNLALACLVHALALKVLFRSSRSCLDIAIVSEPLGKSIARPEKSQGLTVIDHQRERWTALLPAESSALWDWCLAQQVETLLELLALCVALSIDALHRKGEFSGCNRLLHANMLAQALELDTGHWFTPDAEGFFGRLNRTSIVAAIEEAKGVPAAPGWAKLKKAELAQLAAKQVAGTGWLPQPLKNTSRVDDSLIDHGSAGFEAAE